MLETFVIVSVGVASGVICTAMGFVAGMITTMIVLQDPRLRTTREAVGTVAGSDSPSDLEKDNN